MEASMADTMHEFRERAARELRAARHAKSDTERQTHQSIANAYKALAESEAWLEGRIKPIGDKMVLRRK
jgi:type IV secretory pathway VirB9-like protein